MRESFGSDGQPGSYTDIDYTACIFMVGHNMAATQTVLWSRILDRLDGPDPPKLIVVDPRLSESAKRATIHLALNIGTNVALLNSIQYLIFKNGWVDEGYVSKHVSNVEGLREKVMDYPPEKVSKITGISQERLEEAARIIGTSETLLSTCLQGVYQSNQATAAACQVNNINLLLGKIGKPGSGIYQMNGQPTAQNNREVGCNGEFPGFRNYNNPAHMQELARLWNIDFEKLPHWNQPTHVENMLSYIAAGSIEMFWINGTNPLVSLPNLPKVRELLTKPEVFVVVQDIYLTETAEIADVVLPAAQWGEKTGCFTNVDRTVHLSHKAVDPPGEARSDLTIFVDFAKRMDFRDKDGNPLMPGETPEELFEAWKKLSKGRPCDYSWLTYSKLTGGSGIQWPCNEDHPNGKERLFDDGYFFTDTEYCESFGHDLETGAPYTKNEYLAMNPAGRAILKPSHYIPSQEEPNEEYPLRLSTGRNVYQFHTRTKTGRAKVLQEACPEPVVQVSKEDAESLGIEDGEEVLVKSRRGAVQLKCQIGRPSKGQVFIPFHFGYWDAKDDRARAANELTWGKSAHHPRQQQRKPRLMLLQTNREMGSRVETTLLQGRRRPHRETPAHQRHRPNPRQTTANRGARVCRSLQAQRHRHRLPAQPRTPPRALARRHLRVSRAADRNLPRPDPAHHARPGNHAGPRSAEEHRARDLHRAQAVPGQVLGRRRLRPEDLARRARCHLPLRPRPVDRLYGPGRPARPADLSR